MSIGIEALCPVPQKGTSDIYIYVSSIYYVCIYICQQWHYVVSLWSEWMICEVLLFSIIFGNSDI